MTHARRHPAVQAAAGIGALLALTWPLLVFERPVYVVSSFFAIWLAVIGSLFAFSMAQTEVSPDGSVGEQAEEDVDDRSD